MIQISKKDGNNLIHTSNIMNNRKKEVIAIIPARGGSKGIPRKNIIDLCGKPLIAYSIEVALNAKLIDRVIVSTDDEEIAEISKCYGAEVPFLRPKELSGDHSSLIDAMEFTLNKLKSMNYYPDIIVHLFPTHLFRTPKLVNFLISKMIDGCSSVKTAKKIIHDSYSIFSKDENGQFVSLLDLEKTTTKSKIYLRPFGTFFGLHRGGNGKAYVHTLNNPIELIDIDTFSDLYLAEMVIKNKMFDFNIYSNAANFEVCT